MNNEYKLLLDRLVAGAEYIENIGRKHSNYDAALKKYNRLDEELRKYQTWLT